MQKEEQGKNEVEIAHEKFLYESIQAKGRIGVTQAQGWSQKESSLYRGG